MLHCPWEKETAHEDHEKVYPKLNQEFWCSPCQFAEPAVQELGNCPLLLKVVCSKWNAWKEMWKKVVGGMSEELESVKLLKVLILFGEI